MELGFFYFPPFSFPLKFTMSSIADSRAAFAVCRVLLRSHPPKVENVRPPDIDGQKGGKKTETKTNPPPRNKQINKQNAQSSEIFNLKLFFSFSFLFFFF
jgi:hypothetical protein